MADQLTRETRKWMQREQLHSAAANGNLAEVVRLVETAKYPVDRFDDLGKTPLHHAVNRGHIEVVKYLLEAGADVNAHDERVIGNTPLREVAGTCSIIMARILIEAGADPRTPGWMQITAIHCAEERTDPQGHAVYKLLKKAADVFNEKLKGASS